MFYLFGAFLIYTAYRIARTPDVDEDVEYEENAVVRLLRRVVPVAKRYHDARSFVQVDGKRMITPMLVVMIALGTTDLLFALDSIPAVFGLTRDAVPGVLGERVRADGPAAVVLPHRRLMSRLRYLRFGLSVLLVFIGVKLILEVVREDWQPFGPGASRCPCRCPAPGSRCSSWSACSRVTVVASMIADRRRRPTPEER